MSHTEKNKGGQKSWATAEQRDWLTSKLPDYATSKGSSTQGEFWPILFEEWFERWPVGQEGLGDGLTADVEEQSKKCKAVSSGARTTHLLYSHKTRMIAIERLVQKPKPC